LEANKQIKLANLAGGKYVNKAKLDAKLSELEALKEQLSQADSKLKTFNEMDINGLKSSLEEWKVKESLHKRRQTISFLK
jgi:hypothetical protein